MGDSPSSARERRLAAIMFTDMVGYSAISDADESLALALLDEQRKIVSPLFLEFGGREINRMADGFLVEFSSAVEAVRCALKVQDVLAKRSTGHPIILRIGIHVGDVVADGDDVLGSGVNIASRIEPLADPGGICVTEDVVRQVHSALDVRLESMGRPALKNISDPPELFRVVADGLAVSKPKPAASKLSVAVLPFVNMSADPENEYFSDGLTEDILTQVSRIRSLKVISRTSAMQYKGTKKHLREIGRELGVANLLEGSVRKAGTRVRIAAQLIDAETDAHLWAETYDRELSDIFAVQSEVAERIAEALKATITPNDLKLISRQPTRSVEAYQLYLRGKDQLNRRTKDGLESAIATFQKVLEMDDTYAQAYVGVAEGYLFLALFEHLPPLEAFPKARASLERALTLAPDLAEAHASLGLVKFQHDWDWEAAERELKAAIDLNPNYASGHHYYADYLKGMGRFDEAIRQIEIARELDPLSLPISSGVGHVFYLSRRYDEAIAAYRHTLELDPKRVQARLWFGRPLLQKGMYEEAVAELEAARQLSGGSTISMAVLAHAYAASGRKEEAERILAELVERGKTLYVPSYWIGLIYVGLNDEEQAMNWLDRAYDERSSWLAWSAVEPRFDSLRNSARFQALMARIGFPNPS